MKQPSFWNLTRAPDGASAEIRIAGDIIGNDDAFFYDWLDMEGTAPGGVRAQLKALGDVPVTVWIDSPGGRIDAAGAIYTALKEYPGRKTAKIEARAFSAASVIAMACDEVLMGPLAVMMIHRVEDYSPTGNAQDARHMADVLDQCDETLINAYQLKTGMDRAALYQMMAAETWMCAQEAIRLSFADGMLYEADSETAQRKIVAQAREVYGQRGDALSRPDGWTEDADAELAIENART